VSQVYFVKTRTVYDPYKDFFRLAELSGYPIIYCDEIDIESYNTYIFTPLNGENNHGWKDAKCQIILWDMEWRIGESSYEWAENLLVIPPGVQRVWASDRWYAARIGAQYVPLGSHAGLAGDAIADGNGWDVAPLAYRTGRRTALLDDMERRGLTVVPNGWGDDRDARLKEAKVVLHIHQHDKVPTVAPLRFAIAAAWHKPLISESVHDVGIFESSVLYADYAHLTDYTTLMVRRYPEFLRDKADALHDMLVISNSFRSFVEGAL
jgi:hypothetical protein